jgi:hypothetical protein
MPAHALRAPSEDDGRRAGPTLHPGTRTAADDPTGLPDANRTRLVHWEHQVTRPTPFFKSLIHRLSGAPTPTAADAGEVFRGFAESVERRLGGEAANGPKIRLPASESAGPVWR